MSTVTRQDLVSVLGERTLHITDKNKLSKSVASYLTSEHKTLDLNSLMRDIMQYRLEHGIVEAVAVSAYELTEVVINDIEVLLKEHIPQTKKVIIDTRIDKSVIGGIRIELPRETLDLSVKSKLNLFKRLVAGERN